MIEFLAFFLLALNVYFFLKKPICHDFLGSLFYGYFIVSGSFLYTSRSVGIDDALGRYVYILILYAALILVDYYANWLRSNVPSTQRVDKKLPFKHLTSVVVLLPFLHVLYVGDIPFLHFIFGHVDYLERREAFGKLLNVPMYIKYLPNVVFSILGPLLISQFWAERRFYAALLLGVYILSYSLFSAALLPPVIFGVCALSLILYKQTLFKFKFLLISLMILGALVANYEAENLSLWSKSERMEEGSKVEMNFHMQHDNDHPFMFSDLNRLSCIIPYEFKSINPFWEFNKTRNDYLFIKFCKSKDGASHDIDTCSKDDDCLENKCRLSASMSQVCLPKEYDCAIDASKFALVDEYAFDSLGNKNKCVSIPKNSEEIRPVLFHQKLSGLLYRVYFVPPDVGLSWYFFEKYFRNIDNKYDLESIRSLPNKIGVWAYQNRFPTRYLSSVSAYGSIELLPYVLFGNLSIFFVIFLYMLIRLSLVRLADNLHVIANVLLAIFIWQAGFYSILVSHGLGLIAIYGMYLHLLARSSDGKE